MFINVYRLYETKRVKRYKNFSTLSFDNIRISIILCKM